MFAYFILGIALLIGFVLLSKWFVQADVQSVAKALKVVAGVVAVLFVVYLMLSGRWNLLPGLLFVFLPWVGRLRGLFRGLGGFGYGGFDWGGPSAGQSSTVETRFLRMRLDHDSGEMDGDILDGRFRGRSLGDLSEGELIALLRECVAEDAQSARVLETYLDRVHGPDWRERARETHGQARGEAGGGMAREEALEILGLEPGASAEEIKAAYHRLIGRLHPDQGGSTYLAAKLNQARDVLLGN